MSVNRGDKQKNKYDCLLCPDLNSIILSKSLTVGSASLPPYAEIYVGHTINHSELEAVLLLETENSISQVDSQNSSQKLPEYSLS